MASYKELLEIGQDFMSFVNTGLDPEIFTVHAVARRLAEGAGISHKTVERMAAVVENYHFLIAAEMWCADCRVNVTALDYMCRMQPQLSAGIITKGRAEDDLQEQIGLNEILVPMVVILDSEYKPVGHFFGRSKFVMEAGIEVIRDDYHAGHFTEHTISDILDIIEAVEGRNS